ncbi:MAG: CDP-glycerol glycerophosphotransferase family protein [Coriobacteriales bacterium]|jgi:CDP-glycerol glycerophosphotransferase|nr:CDP-glycerol glycerophosphotransferase family protein [Coriobacteriales bacterium]
MAGSAYRAARTAALAVLRHLPWLRVKVRKAYWAWRARRYRRQAALHALEPRTVLFESFGGRSCACSPRALFEAMCRDPRFDGWEFVWSFRQGADNAVLAASPLLAQRACTVERGTAAYEAACARAQYWVVNNRMAEWISPRDGQVYVQCWHGTPLKRLGLDVSAGSAGALNTAPELAWRFAIDAQKWSWLVSPSAYTSEKLTSAFGVSASAGLRVAEVGYPRNDSLVRMLASPDAAGLARAMRLRRGLPAHKKLLLYAPTWRDTDYRAGVGYVAGDQLLDLERLREALGDEWCVMVRAHYYIVGGLATEGCEGFAYDVSAVQDINELYAMADVLVTDYSSTLFDYANTGRPVIYHWHDLDRYRDDLRGFYFDPHELPGPKCSNTDEVAQAVLELDGWQAVHGKALQELRARFCAQDDGHASERVVALVFREARDETTSEAGVEAHDETTSEAHDAD